MSNTNSLVGISPRQFIHVLDMNTNITRLEVGPKTFHLQTNEKIVRGPAPMICVPPGSFCLILNPVREYEAGVKCELNLGQIAVKLHGDPFPLYPGEELQRVPDFGKASKTNDYKSAIQRLPVIPAKCALRLRALQDHRSQGILVPAGHVWQEEGPKVYVPRPEVEIEELIQPTIIKTGEVLRMKAIQDTIDQNGKKRVTGDEWLIREPGAYLRGVWEEVVGIEMNITLTAEVGLHLKATQNIVDFLGKPRDAGDEWLLTREEIEEYSPQVGIEMVKTVKKLVVKKGQYAVIKDPVGPDGKNQLGTRVLRTGLCSFFLQPGESIEDGKIKNASILTAEESIVLQATEVFTDTMYKGMKRRPGDKWMIRGPLSYIPPTSVEVIKRRKTIPLSKNEGVYVQNTKTGKVRAVMGPQAYMLTADEELWEKVLSPETEELLIQGGGLGSVDIRKVAYFEQSIDPVYLQGRDKSRVVTFRCPGSTAVKVNNHQLKTSRVVFGPDLVVLGPDENFNVLSLSAGKPKRSNALKSLCLMLGPDFITEVMEVETSDHARLRLQVAFNNFFEVDRTDEESVKKIFQVPDFIGFACRQLGSRIRASVALTPFDDFHKHSARIIQLAVFGEDKTGKLLPRLKFDVNNLVISSIDIQNIEPVDTKMRDSLMKSVQLAIEISTKSVEASAEHEANRREQIAKGQLERQRLLNEVEAEKERARLYELRAEAAAVESTGQAKAEAQAEAEKTLIECQSEITAATLKAQAEEIEHYSKLETQSMLRSSEMAYKRRMMELEVHKQKSNAQIEVSKFAQMVGTIGSTTLTKIAQAGPRMKLNMLTALGMESVLLTDGSSPINLFNTAEGLIGGRSST
ncbi:major vault protein-like isoform X2 [Babylonia areolata]|uniref:major vault protein-like isoform X2 n=1 Tax=Babylonia areolata TaxID=304850 RepID=UPI003FD41958